MGSKFPVSENAIRSHKCCLCKHLLSVPPIMNAGLESELYKCGRCEKVKCQIYTRNQLFENVAQHLSFPCSYEGCSKRIPWGRVEPHERDCSYRTIKCPVYYHNCSKVLRIDKLLEHFQDTHKKNIKTLGAAWTVNIEFDYVFLIQLENEYFFVYIFHLDGAFAVAVLALDETKYTKFNVKLLPPQDDKFAVSYDGLPTIRYDERSHCYMCHRKKCNEPHHPYSEKNKSCEMDVSSFTSKIKKELVDSVKASNGDLRYCLTLIPDETITINRAQPFEQEETVVERGTVEEEEAAAAMPSQGQGISSSANVEALRKNLSCPYCMIYMAAPIYTCVTGHTICNVCRPRLVKCPMCSASFGDSRNYTLEDMVKDIMMPCQYDNKGCTFMAKMSKLYIHEQDCSFSTLLTE